MKRQLYLASEAATEQLGARLAPALRGGGVVFLFGQLGAGKTTLVRGLLRALGHGGTVKSPTYTLVEEYRLGEDRVYHFDLYRLAGAEDLEGIGLRDYLAPSALCLVEWPERGQGMLPDADLEIRLTVEGDGRSAQLKTGPNCRTDIQDAVEKTMD